MLSECSCRPKLLAQRSGPIFHQIDGLFSIFSSFLHDLRLLNSPFFLNFTSQVVFPFSNYASPFSTMNLSQRDFQSSMRFSISFLPTTFQIVSMKKSLFFIMKLPLNTDLAPNLWLGKTLQNISFQNQLTSRLQHINLPCLLRDLTSNFSILSITLKL